MSYVTLPLSPVAKAVLWTIVLVCSIADHDWLLSVAAVVLVALAGADARRARRALAEADSLRRLAP